MEAQSLVTDRLCCAKPVKGCLYYPLPDAILRYSYERNLLGSSPIRRVFLLARTSENSVNAKFVHIAHSPAQSAQDPWVKPCSLHRRER